MASASSIYLSVANEEVIREVSAFLERHPNIFEFEKRLVSLFLYSKGRYASEIEYEKDSSLQRSFCLMTCLEKYMEGEIYHDSSELYLTFLNMYNLCAAANNIALPLWEKQKCEKPVSDAERDFIAFAKPDRFRHHDYPSSVESEREFVNELAALFLSIKATIKKFTNPEKEGYNTIITWLEENMLVDVKNSLRGKCNLCMTRGENSLSKFNLAFKAFKIFVGYLAAEEVRTSNMPEVKIQLPPVEPYFKIISELFYVNFSLYMAVKYKYIKEGYYRTLCSERVNHHFTENLGKSVILLSFVYKKVFRLHLKKLNSMSLITKFIKDSVSKYPDSSYRYLVLLSFLSEVSLIPYIKSTFHPFERFFNIFCMYYQKTGIMEFEALLKRLDNFQGLKAHTDRIAGAWEKMGSLAIASQNSRFYTLEDEGIWFLNQYEHLKVQSFSEPVVHLPRGNDGITGSDRLGQGRNFLKVENNLGDELKREGAEGQKDENKSGNIGKSQATGKRNNKKYKGKR